MTQPLPTVYQYIVRELAPSEHDPEEVPLAIVCEPRRVRGEATVGSKIALHLHAGISPKEAQSIADTLQSKVKGLWHVPAPAVISTDVLP